MFTPGRRRYEAGLLAVLGVAVTGSAAVVLTQRSIAWRDDDYRFFDPVIEVKRLIDQTFVREVDQEALQQGAIRGMMEVLEDDYSEFIPPTFSDDFNKEVLGEYVGIGAQIDMVDGWLTIVSPLEDTPAFREGLMAGDRVTQIDGESTHGLTIDQCIDRLTGERGTPVVLTIERGSEVLEITIVRDEIKTLSVKGVHRIGEDGSRWDFMLDGERGIVYVRLNQFTPGCAQEVLDALLASGIERGRVKGMILDLRWNVGGVLQEAIALADLFLTEGVIVSTRGRAFPEEVATAREAHTLPDFPMVVLQNEGSASASEVLAGALVENGRAVVLGTRSYGKGSVQVVQPLTTVSGAQVRLTQQGYYLPTGRSIQRHDDSAQWGVDPTPGFYVPMTDEQIGELFQVRRDLEVIRATDGSAPEAEGQENWSDGDWVVERLKDPQLEAALQAVRLRQDTGDWQPVGAEGPGGDEVALEELVETQALRDRLIRELVRIDRRISTLSGVAGEDGREQRDLWDDQIDLLGGHVVVLDEDGHEVSRLRITGGNVERWLIDADLEPVGEAESPAP
jgi:carboxyl-terminal processing protease